MTRSDSYLPKTMAIFFVFLCGRILVFANFTRAIEKVDSVDIVSYEENEGSGVTVDKCDDMNPDDFDSDNNNIHPPPTHVTCPAYPRISTYPTGATPPNPPKTSTFTTISPQCPEINQISINDQVIVWPDTNQGADAVSNPICLDKFYKIIKRHCDVEWDSAPTCISIQQPINPCPFDLTSINGLYCYTILEKTKYPPACPYPRQLGWNDYIGLDLPVDGPIWMPLNRVDTDEYGIDVLRYTELTNKYKNPFQICTQSCRTFFYKDTFLDKKCQVYHNSTHVEAVSCDDEYSAVCVYNILAYQESSLCKQKLDICKEGTYSPGSKCFCETTSQDVGDPAEFLLPHQNLLFSNSSCKIGLQNTKNESAVPFIWTMSNIPINYTNWAPNANFSDQYGMLRNGNWTFGNCNSNCSIYQLSITADEGKLRLEITGSFYQLKITKYKSFLSKNNSEPLVYCFTDADAKSIIYRVTNFTELYSDENETYIINFSPISVDQSGPGNYWCEAFLYPNLDVVTSNSRIIMNFAAEYVVIYKLTNYADKLSNYPLIPENLETLQNLFRNELPKQISFYPRIFKINNIDEEKKEITITFHLTSAEASNNTEEEFNTLKTICMEQSMFEFIAFRNVHYCPNVTTNHEGQAIVWQRTVWKEKTLPLLNGQVAGYCVTSNITLIQRTCVGNFVDGVYWSDMNDFCQFYPQSHLTKQIINILNQNEDDALSFALNELKEISENYESFNTLDFVLAVKFLQNISIKTPDLNLLSEIVSNFMKISRAVLLSAQLNFRATDILLESVDIALENTDYGEWKKPNFAIKSANIKDGILGFQLQNCTNNTDCEFVPIQNSSLLYNHSFITTQHVEVAISLSTELYNQIMNYSRFNDSYVPKLVVAIYYGSQLFVELENLKSSNLVVGVLLPDFPETFNGPLTIYHYANLKNQSLEYNCSYWKFSEIYSGSWAIENTEELTEALVCEFYHLTHFAIPILTPVITNNSQMCIPDDNVNRKCFSANQDLCTIIDLDTPLNKFCLIEDSIVVPTKCFENFNGEAHISQISKSCSGQKLSSPLISILSKIQENLNGSHGPILDLLLTLSLNYDNITDVEFLFVASFLKVISNDTMDMSKFAKIMNNLMKVPETAIYKAQVEYKVLDILLNTTEDILAKGECGEWKTENFAIKCLRIDEENVGIALKNCPSNLTNCDLELINFTDFPFNNNFETEEVHAAVALSRKLYSQIFTYTKANNSGYVPKLMISIYYSSVLFIDIEATPSLSNFVFGVLLPEFNEKFQGPLLIYYLKSNNSVQYNCSYWKFDEVNNGSWVVESTLMSRKAAVCEFFHLTNFAIPVKKLNGNYFLDTRMENNHINSISIPMSIMNQSTDYYNICTHESDIIFHNPASTKKINTEVELYSKKRFKNTVIKELLENVQLLPSNSQNMEDVFQILFYNTTSNVTPLETLEMLINIINFCLKVNKNAIFEAQIDFYWADKILYNIGTILKNFKETYQIEKQNILLIILSMEDVAHFQGFFITKDREVECITQESILDNKIDVRVLLSKELRHQIVEKKSNLIFTIFYSEALFPVKKNTLLKLPIIEVLIPQLDDGIMKGHISITYQNTTKGHCSYWNHKITNNIITEAGYWKMESEAKISGNVATCRFNHVTHFALVTYSQNITTDLEEILASNSTGLEKLRQVESITTSNHNNLVAIDIYLISQIITNTLSEGPFTTIITQIISTLFMVPRTVLRESQEVHSATDIILYAVEEMARMVENIDVHNQNFSFIVKDLLNTNLTGVKLSECENYFCKVDELDQFININNYTDNESVSAMVLFSEELIQQIRNSTNNSKIGISIYYSDVFFNEVGCIRNTTKIFGITFPGISDALRGPVSVIYDLGTTTTSDSNRCSYWYYQANPTGKVDNATLGKWMNDTSKQRRKTLAICNFSHVTHFGMLLADNDYYDDDPILDLITDIGSILSLFGILMIGLTALLFQKWRQNTGNKILINFSIAISLKIITLYVSVFVKETSKGIGCTITGIVLHYAILSECAWMLTVAILQFKRFVEVLGGPPKYVLVKAFICGWIFPIFPVVCVIAIDPDNYEKGIANLCYPSNLGLYLGVWLPVLLILTINCIIFIFIVYNVFHKKTECIDKSNHDVLFQWRLALLLFFMLGLNWTFGFLGLIEGDSLFTYLYSVTASLQGFVLFLFFIVFNKSTRFLYTQAIKQWFYARGIFKVWQTKRARQ